MSAFQDALIRLAYDFTTHHVYRAKNPSAAEHMAIVATGGYGRGLLAPGSDIDLLFLLPYKQTAWGESVAEYMLYLLWDLGFKVGHATRTIDQCVRLSHSDMTIRTALLDARLILGDEALFTEFQRRFRKDVLEGHARPFIDAKLEEQNRPPRPRRRLALSRRAEHQGRQGRLARSAYVALARQAPLSGQGGGGVRRGRRVHARPNIGASGAARAFSGRSAVSCIS